MRVTKYEHSCVLVEDGDVRILIDPGELTHGFVNLTGLSAILVTHQHFDHIDLARIAPLLERNPAAALYADEATASILADRDIRARTARQGDRLDVGVDVVVHGAEHAVIHPEIPSSLTSGTSSAVGSSIPATRSRSPTCRLKC